MTARLDAELHLHACMQEFLDDFETPADSEGLDTASDLAASTVGSKPSVTPSLIEGDVFRDSLVGPNPCSSIPPSTPR